MHGKFIQISTVVSANGIIALYALDENGKIFEKLTGTPNSPWTPIL